MGSAHAVCYLQKPHAAWPMDLGDDPSFEHAHRHGVAPSWGICRPDLRNDLVDGDVVVFFACDRLQDRRPARYVWVGYATVATRVSQVDIFRRKELGSFRDYPNLLIRPDSDVPGAYVHHESAPPELWHQDWLWRLVNSIRREKEDFEEVHRTGKYDPRTTRADGSLIALAPNYIIFSRSPRETWIAATPPFVAESDGGPEKWRSDPIARELHALVFTRPERASLRTTNEQSPHPRLPLESPAEEVRQKLQDLIERHELDARPALAIPSPTPPDT